MKYYLYARKSTEDEERQVMSIEAQIIELEQFAKRENIEIAERFIESKSAKMDESFRPETEPRPKTIRFTRFAKSAANTDAYASSCALPAKPLPPPQAARVIEATKPTATRAIPVGEREKRDMFCLFKVWWLVQAIHEQISVKK